MNAASRTLLAAFGITATSFVMALRRAHRRGIRLPVPDDRRRGLLILSGGVVSILIAVRPRAAA